MDDTARISFTTELCQSTLLSITENVRNDQIRTAAGRWVQLTGLAGSCRMLDLLYSDARRDEIATLRGFAPDEMRDVCPWGHTSPPTKYCPRRKGTAADPGGWQNARRCAVCVSSRWERILYATIQMLGYTAEKRYVEGYEIDIYIPELRRGIEYNGQQHYERGLFTPDLTHRLWKDQEKLFACARADIQLLYVRYDDPNPVRTVWEFLQN